MTTPTPTPASTTASQPTGEVTPDAIKGVLEGLLSGIDDESQAAAAAFATTPAVIKAKEAIARFDIDLFNLHLQYPFEKLIDGVLLQAGVKDPRAQFVFREHRYLNWQFRTVFDQHEGPSCCADKSRWVVKALARSFVTGEPITIDHTQQYTYHLPTITFTTHEQIVEYFDGLYRLFLGKPQAYLAATLKLHRRVEQARATEGPGEHDLGEAPDESTTDA